MIAAATPLISIITTFYNEEELLPRCLQSVKNQSYRNIELLLINDGSTDNSEKISEDFKTNFINCKIISIENVGHSEARNIGLQNATGQYLTFLDADDELENDMVASCVRKIMEDKSDLVISNFTIYNQKNLPEMIGGFKSRNQHITHAKDLQAEMFNNGISENVWAKLFNTKLAKKIVFEKELWFDDRPFLFEYLCIANKVSFIDTSLLKIHKRDTSITRRIIEPKRILDGTKVFNLELKTAKKYNKLIKFRQMIAEHHLNFLVDNLLIQIIEKNKIQDLKLVRHTLINQIIIFKNVLVQENISISNKYSIMLHLLHLPIFFGWRFTNFIFRILKRKRMHGILKLK